MVLIFMFFRTSIQFYYNSTGRGLNKDLKLGDVSVVTYRENAIKGKSLLLKF